MVAGRSETTSQRFLEPSEDVIRGRSRLWRFTRSDVDTLLREGLVPEDASMELLNGLIVHKDRSAVGDDPLIIGRGHELCVERLSNLRGAINTTQRHVESQQPLLCYDIHLPEPDFMIVRGTLEQYEDYPSGRDAWCVVEVADSSYERDAGEKLRGYARAGVGQYIIINLRNRTAEVHESPNIEAGMYSPPRIIAAADELRLRVGEDDYFAVSLSTLLP